MKALKQLCIPRKSVFDVSKRDTVLNLTHLTDDKISAAEFFEENSVTEGMRTLLIEAHRRLQGKSSQAVFKLTQAMGGGKTHNLIALGLLTKTPKLRPTILKELPGAKELPSVRVVAFSGRETDIPNGIWGEIARQLGKEHSFKDYYQPLKAPGRSAWINLLKGEPTLILLDELPPYLDNAKSVSVGNSDLSKVTATALTNLFEAVSEADLSNVCVVTVYAEVGGEATAASQKVENGLYTTDEIEVSFLAVDSTGTHPTGPATTWKNRITLKYRVYAGGKGERMLELSAAPNKGNGTQIHYTTNGSDPKVSGGTYESPVALRKNTPIVLAYAERDGVESEVLQITIDWSKKEDDKPIDPEKSAVWKRPHAYYFTAETYEFLERLNRHDAKVSGVKVTIVGDRWVELNLHPLIELTPAQLADAVEAVRKIPETGQLSVEAAALHFPTGQRLLDWLNEAKAEPKPGEVQQ